MPGWCEQCDRSVEGESCEVCGTAIVETPREPLPGKWKFFIAASAIYLLYRVYQLISWLTH